MYHVAAKGAEATLSVDAKAIRAKGQHLRPDRLCHSFGQSVLHENINDGRSNLFPNRTLPCSG